MFDLLKKTTLMGIGITSMTRDKIEELTKEIVKESKLSEEEGKKLVEDLLKRSEEARKDLESRVEKLVKSALEKLDIPSRAEMKKLQARVKKLETQIRNRQKENSDS